MDLDLVELIHIFGLTNIHTFGPKTSLIRLFSLMFNYAKPRLLTFQFAAISENAPFGKSGQIRYVVVKTDSNDMLMQL